MIIFTFPATQIDTTGLATEAEQQAQTALLTTIDASNTAIEGFTQDIHTFTNNIDGKTPNLGQALMSNSVPVTIASDQSAIPVSGPLTDSQLRASAVPVSAASLPLPTGAATEATLASIDGKVPANLTVSATRLLVDGSGVTQPVSGTVNAAQSGTWNINNVSGTVSLPTGAATETTLASIDAGIPAALGQTTMAASMPVTISSDQSAVPVSQSGTWTVQPGNTANTTPWLVVQSGKTAVDKVRNDYTSTSVTTSAYVQLVASLAAACTEIEIFDSSGSTLVLATGAAASESDKVYVTPGGNGRIPLAIAASTRISIKAVSANASVGEIVINFYG